MGLISPSRAELIERERVFKESLMLTWDRIRKVERSTREQSQSSLQFAFDCISVWSLPTKHSSRYTCECKMCLHKLWNGVGYMKLR